MSGATQPQPPQKDHPRGPGQMEIWQTVDGSEIAVVAASWHLNDKITFVGLADEFKKDPALAWRNYGSRVQFSLETALRDPSVLERNVNTTRSDPYVAEQRRFEPWFRGRPKRRYFIHIDLAKNNDGAGVAMVHREGKRTIVDFVHREVAMLGGEIDFRWLRETFVFEVIRRGFNVVLVTLDQWNSVEFQQHIRDKAIETDLESADRHPAPYDTLIGALNDNSLDYFLHPVLFKELRELRRINGKRYDHPKNGSKDASDALACAVYRCILDEMENPQEPPGVISVKRNPGVQTNFGDRGTF